MNQSWIHFHLDVLHSQFRNLDVQDHLFALFGIIQEPFSALIRIHVDSCISISAGPNSHSCSISILAS